MPYEANSIGAVKSVMNALPKRVYLPDRGDVIWIVLDPRVGHEQSGRRPALVLSPRIFTEKTGLSIVCPITSTVRGFDYEVPFSNGDLKGAILPNHIRSVDVLARKVQFIERAPRIITDTVTEYVQLMNGG